MAKKHTQESSVAQEVQNVENTETLENRSDARGSSKLSRVGKDYTWEAKTKNSTFSVKFAVQGHSVEINEYTIARTVGDTTYSQTGTSERIDVAVLLARAFRHLAIDPSAYKRLGEEGETLESILSAKGGSKGSTSADVPTSQEVEVLRASARIVPGFRLTGAAWHAIALAVAGHVTACQMACAALGTDRWDALQRAAIAAAAAAAESASKADSTTS